MSEMKFIQSVERAIGILLLYSNDVEELTLTEISLRMGLHKSTTFGLINTLEHYDLIQKSLETGKYRLGIRLLQLGNLVFTQLDLRKVTGKYLKQLVNKHSETVHLAILDGADVVYIDKVDSPRSIQMNSAIGKRMPAYATGIGKAILAFLPEEEWRRHVSSPLKKFTENTITSLDDLEKELERIRRNGYAEDNEEIEDGLRCVAAPMFDVNNQVVGSVSLSAPTTRMSKEKSRLVAVDLLSITLEISMRLGSSVPHARQGKNNSTQRV